MSESREAWIALNLLTDLWPALRARLVEACDGPVGVWNGDRDRLRSVRGLRTDIITKIQSFDWKSRVCIELERAREQGFSVLTPVDPSYPPMLLEIHDPPPALYVQGELVPADHRAVAIVGSRRASFYGLECAREFGRDLAAQGLTVVSGLALGADAAAHQGALEAGGRTLAVLGSGLDVPYPRRNRKLLGEVAQHGAVLSEFPLGTPPLPHHFPQRNRVIAGLCLGTVVVEATARSGSLVTARLAVESNREVFAIPGRITSERSLGTNTLIRAGAALVQCAADVVQELPPPEAGPAAPPPPDPPAPPALPEPEAAVLSCIGADEPVPVAALAEASRMEMGSLLDALLSLEMRRLITALPGGRYVRRGPGSPPGA